MYGMPPLMDHCGLGMGMAMGHVDMAAKSDSNSKHKMPYGSWKCEKCNNINYPFRTKCNRQNCGAVKPSEGQKSPSEPADENDQEMKSQCNEKMSDFVFCKTRTISTKIVRNFLE